MLVELGATGASLRVEVERQASQPAMFDTSITIDAFPFSGTLRTIFTLSDLREWAKSLDGATDGQGRVLLGGGRAAELSVVSERQIGGDPDALALTVAVSPSGDDPFPSLTFLIFDVPRSWTQIAADVRAID